MTTMPFDFASLVDLSALPDAPVVPEPVRVARARRTRITVAGLLQRAAAAVAPPECAPAR
jgi:hypothetical protein